MCTPRCRTCRRNAADEHRCSADVFSVDDGSAIRVLMALVCHIVCGVTRATIVAFLVCSVLIVSNINGSPYSQAVLHFLVLHFQRPLRSIGNGSPVGHRLAAGLLNGMRP